MKIARVVDVEPYFLRPSDAVRYVSLPCDLIETGIAAGDVKAYRLQSPLAKFKPKKARRKIHLIDRATLVRYVQDFAKFYAEQLSEKATDARN